jgi:hypothetical protein
MYYNWVQMGRQEALYNNVVLGTIASVRDVITTQVLGMESNLLAGAIKAWKCLYVY